MLHYFWYSGKMKKIIDRNGQYIFIAYLRYINLKLNWPFWQKKNHKK